MSKEYLSIIQNQKSHKLTLSKNFRFSPYESQIGLSIVPPLNCDIRFKIGNYKLVLPKFSLSKEEKELPLEWKNYIDNDKENNDIDYKKKLLSTKPVNQGHCGSCFAIAIATTISDNFVFGLNLDYNPSLSPMYILSCLGYDTISNNECNGGNPSAVIDDIIKNGGITTNCFQDYYKICDSNEYCNGKGEEHMNKTISMEDVNTMIPKCGNCTNITPKIYQIKEKIVSYDINTIKLHIKNYGSAVGGFIVYTNFINDIDRGMFKSTKGIYINSVNYSQTPDYNTIKGGHAISIVGWGSEKNVYIEGNTYPKVDFWICRNSWSENWGYGGYFKYAMYQTYQNLKPINEGVAFETDNSKYGESLGGVLLIKPDKIVDPKSGMQILDKVDCKVEYKCENEDIKSIKHSKKSEQNLKKIIKENKIIKYILYICLGILFLILLYYLFENKKKKR